MVLNAGNKQKDLDHFKKIREQHFQNMDVTFKSLDDYSLVALQGPKAHLVLQDLLKGLVELNKIGFMTHFSAVVSSINLDIFRSGYTGEDGFEISVHNDQVINFVNLLLKDERVKPAGLGARDSLRLEAGLCLHGNDIDESTNPAEAGLMWTVRKTPVFLYIFTSFHKIYLRIESFWDLMSWRRRKQILREKELVLL